MPIDLDIDKLSVSVEILHVLSGIASFLCPIGSTFRNDISEKQTTCASEEWVQFIICCWSVNPWISGSVDSQYGLLIC